MKQCDSPQHMVADYVFQAFTQDHNSEWISFLMKRTGGSHLSRAATIILSDISKGGFHIHGENQPFFFLRLGKNAYLFDECIVVQAPELPESVVQTLWGRDAGKTFGYERLEGIAISETERLSNDNLRCVLNAPFSRLPESSATKALYFWAKLLVKTALSVRISGLPGQRRLNDRVTALEKFMK